MGFGYGQWLLDAEWDNIGDGGHDRQGGAPRCHNQVEKGTDFCVIRVTKRSWMAALVTIVHGGVYNEVADTTKLYEALSSEETRG